MVTVMNDYVSKIELKTDDFTKSILSAAFIDVENIQKTSIISKANRYIIDVKLKNFNVEEAVQVMNQLMEQTRYHYSAFFVRFNEGNMVRYRYATCKENRDGFYCDVVIS